MVLYNVTTASITSPRGKIIPRRVSTTSYSHGKGHDHKQIHHPDDAYFYEYLVHGVNNENHHGETQYFGQAEYRDDETVSESIVTRNCLVISWIKTLSQKLKSCIVFILIAFRQILCSTPGRKGPSCEVQSD